MSQIPSSATEKNTGLAEQKNENQPGKGVIRNFHLPLQPLPRAHCFFAFDQFQMRASVGLALRREKPAPASPVSHTQCLGSQQTSLWWYFHITSLFHSRPQLLVPRNNSYFHVFSTNSHLSFDLTCLAANKALQLAIPSPNKINSKLPIFFLPISSLLPQPGPS